jgi:hypothetical protein
MFVRSEGCWKWRGTLVRGYGQISVHHKRYRAHRLRVQDFGNWIRAVFRDRAA